MEKQIAENEAKQKMEHIENEIYLAKNQARTDASYYQSLKEIEANQQKLTPEYLQKLAIESLSANTKLYFGPSIPNYVQDNVLPFGTATLQGAQAARGHS